MRWIQNFDVFIFLNALTLNTFWRPNNMRYILQFVNDIL